MGRPQACLRQRGQYSKFADRLMKCIHCNANLAPAMRELLPGPFWGVSLTCGKCDKENRVRWPVTAGLMLLSITVVIAAGFGVASIHPLDFPAFLVGAVAATLLVAVFGALLSAYLRTSKRPFAGK